MAKRIITSDHEQTTTKVWVDTMRILRLTAALTEETHSALLHRLVQTELKRVRRGHKDLG